MKRKNKFVDETKRENLGQLKIEMVQNERNKPKWKCAKQMGTEGAWTLHSSLIPRIKNFNSK